MLQDLFWSKHLIDLNQIVIVIRQCSYIVNVQATRSGSHINYCTVDCGSCVHAVQNIVVSVTMTNARHKRSTSRNCCDRSGG